MVNKE